MALLGGFRSHRIGRRQHAQAVFGDVGYERGSVLLRRGDQGVGHAVVWLGAALAVLAVFVRVEMRVKRPLVPIDLLRDGRLALANGASFVLGFAGYASLFFLSLYLQQAQGLAPAAAGWHLMPQFVLMGATSMMFGQLAHRVAPGRLMAIGYALIGAVMCAMAGFGVDTPFAWTGGALALLGLGMGLAVPATGTVVMALAPTARAGMASATMNALRQTGMTMGIALLGSAMSASAVRSLTAAATSAAQPDAVATARAAVLQHAVPMASPWWIDGYRHAMAHGFAVAMLGAGLPCLLMAAALWLSQHKKVNQPSSIAP